MTRFSDIFGTIWRPYSFVVRRGPPILPWALVDLLPQVKKNDHVVVGVVIAPLQQSGQQRVWYP